MSEGRQEVIGVSLARLACLFAALGFLVYLPAWRGKWLWDDSIEILGNEVMRGPFSGLVRSWVVPSQIDYLPLKSAVQWLEWHAWGDSVLGYHLVSIGLHVASSVLFSRILGRMGVRWAGWAGALFLLHPVAVESVAWISELKNTLSMPLLLLAWDSHLDAGERRVQTGGAGWNRADWRSLSWFAAALAAKASVVMMPVCLLAYAWSKRGRLGRFDVLLSLPYFLLSAGSGLVTVWFQTSRAIGMGDFDIGSLQERLVALPLRLGFYASEWVWPLGLMPLYPRDGVGVWAGVAGWVLLAALVLVVTLAVSRTGRGPVMALVWFCANLIPVLGIFPMSFLKYAWVSDHFAYVPCLGLAALCAMGVGALCDWLESRVSGGRALGQALAVSLLAALALCTLRTAVHYRRAVDFWSWAVEGNPGSWVAHHNLADACSSDPATVPVALDHYRRAIQLKPDYAEGHYSLGVLLAHEVDGREEAIRELGRAVELAPGFADAHNNLANLLAEDSRLEEAAGHYAEVVRLRPDFAQGHANFARLLCRMPGREADALAQFDLARRLEPKDGLLLQDYAALLARIPGRQGDAAESFEASLRLEPRVAERHYNYAAFLALMPGQESAAIREYERALELRPAYPEAHNNLAIVLVRLPGRGGEAEAHWTKALELRPEYAEAQNNLGLLLSGEAGREPEAVRHFEAALRLNPDFAEAHSNLATLLSRVGGRETEAEDHFRKALSLRPAYPDAENNYANLLARQPGREKEALRHYAEALRLVPGAYSIHVNMALVLLRMDGGLGEAVSHVRAALALNPKYPAAISLGERLGLVRPETP